MLQQQSSRGQKAISIFLLCAILLCVIIVYSVSRLSGGSSFNARQEAFQLAQETQAYRLKLVQQGRSAKYNLGYASITVQYSDGTSQRLIQRDRNGQPLPFPGYDPYTSHSEFFAHGWILGTLRSQIAPHMKTISSLDIVIFSQVRVCDQCQQASKGWLREFQSAAGTSAISLSIWQLTRGFNPAKVQQGRPVTSPADVTPVPIAFV